jgi:hypothetical protein
MRYCPIWRWYMYPDDPRKDYAINSAITGSIEVIPKSGRANIATDNLQSRGEHLECAISPYVKKILDAEAEGQPEGKARHYGLIIVRPGKEKELSKSEVVDFISFHRDPKIPTPGPTATRYDLSTYNKVFEELVLKETPPSTAL